MISQQEKGDRVIAFAVMIQSLLVIIQQIMIKVFNMNAEATTTYRVILTAIPMILAIVVSAYRNLVRWVVVYGIAIILLVFTLAFFPQNQPFLVSQSLRFLLPIVIPSFICLTTVYDYNVVEKTLYYISLFTAAFVFFYALSYFRGVFSIDEYNISFSYACLFPMVAIYSHRKIYDILICVIIFIAVLAIGARGPAVFFGVYVVFDLFQLKSKWRFPVLLLIISFFLTLPYLNSWLLSLNLHSRTLQMALSGDFMSDSGRTSIQYYFWRKLWEHPIVGIGLFGDRLLEDVAYCHNVLLEILLNFGVIIGTCIILSGVVAVFFLFTKSDEESRNRILRYFCALVLPLMASGSYLINSELAVFVGMCFLIYKSKKNNGIA